MVKNIVYCQLYSSLATYLLYNTEYLFVTLRILIDPLFFYRKDPLVCNWHNLSHVIFNFKFVPESVGEAIISFRGYVSLWHLFIVEILVTQIHSTHTLSPQVPGLDMRHDQANKPIHGICYSIHNTFDIFKFDSILF